MASPAERTSERIKGVLVQKFEDAIDLSDLPEAQRKDRLVTRALSAAYLTDRYGLSPSITGKHVTDGTDDCGIDSIMIHHPSKKIVFTQAKFFGDPEKHIPQDDFLKFREGITKVLELKFGGMNAKIIAMRADITAALSEIDYTIDLVLIANSTQPISKHIQQGLADFLQKQNEYQSDFVRFEYVDLQACSKIATRLSRPQSVNFKATLRNFGRMAEPMEVVYGLIAGADVAALHKDHGDSIFFENVRFFLGASNVNEGIVDTVKNNTILFPYFNNGITAICNSIRKAGGGGALTDAGFFEFEGFSIVNGAQTVGSISTALGDGEKKDPLVFMKVISLEKAPEHFARQVTRFTNTQNDLQAMDFVSLDPNQERLRNEFAKLNVDYSYRRGQASTGLGPGKATCELREATVALACCNEDIRLAVAAKRNLSQLWEDIQTEPYKALFNDETTASSVWHVVQAMRFVEQVLQQAGAQLDGRDELIAIHGNRFLFFAICQKFKKQVLSFNDLPEKDRKTMRTYTESALQQVIKYSDEKLPDAYAGNIFKNTDRQREIFESL